MNRISSNPLVVRRTIGPPVLSKRLFVATVVPWIMRMEYVFFKYSETPFKIESDGSLGVEGIFLM